MANIGFVLVYGLLSLFMAVVSFVNFYETDSELFPRIPLLGCAHSPEEFFILVTRDNFRLGHKVGKESQGEQCQATDDQGNLKARSCRDCSINSLEQIEKCFRKDRGKAHTDDWPVVDKYGGVRDHDSI